jgi:peptidylprolyl isomerase
MSVYDPEGGLVKTLRMKKTWLLAAMLLMMLVWVVACGPAQPEGDATETAVAPEATEAPAEEATAEEVGTDPTPAVEETAAPATEPTPIEGATLTDSGLQYVEVEAGSGPAPEPGDLVSVHFVGTLEDGTAFGDSYSQGAPITVVLGTDQLLPGWEEGISLMREGGKATLIIPPELGFGEMGAGGVIPPNATLMMEVELVSVTQPPEPTEVDEADYTLTDSGLQYYDLVAGDGDTPDTGDIVTMDFTIWLHDDLTYIISSEQNGEPLTFVLGAGDTVFPGWEEGAASMQVGGTRQLVLPPDLALGDQQGPGIPPSSTLLMEMELLSIKEAPKITEVDEADYTVTESGLKYYDLVEGDGATPEAGQTVEVHYTGWLTDGVKFDSSVDRGQTFTFVLGTGSVIPGWDEGVSTMQVGTTRQLVIPPDLAYGAAGSPGAIPPNATLIFEVELISVR